jgi:hypothetical protein
LLLASVIAGRIVIALLSVIKASSSSRSESCISWAVSAPICDDVAAVMLSIMAKPTERASKLWWTRAHFRRVL